MAESTQEVFSLSAAFSLSQAEYYYTLVVASFFFTAPISNPWLMVIVLVCL